MPARPVRGNILIDLFATGDLPESAAAPTVANFTEDAIDLHGTATGEAAATLDGGATSASYIEQERLVTLDNEQIPSGNTTSPIVVTMVKDAVPENNTRYAALDVGWTGRMYITEGSAHAAGVTGTYYDVRLAAKGNAEFSGTHRYILEFAPAGPGVDFTIAAGSGGS